MARPEDAAEGAIAAGRCDARPAALVRSTVPGRVNAVEMPAPPMQPDPLAGYRAAIAAHAPPPLASIWKRLNAQAIDAAVLAIPGLLLNALVSVQRPDLEQAAPFAVFALALVYYAVLDSRAGGGRTLGKMVVGIRVVGRDGAGLSVPRAALRFLILGLPDFFGIEALLASHPDSPDVLQQLWAALVGVAVCGSQMAGLYLFLFNGRTRQALHDLAVDSFVVRGKAAVSFAGLTIPKPHLAVAVILLAVSTAAPAIAIGMEQQLGSLGGLLGGLAPAPLNPP